MTSGIQTDRTPPIILLTLSFLSSLSSGAYRFVTLVSISCLGLHLYTVGKLILQLPSEKNLFSIYHLQRSREIQILVIAEFCLEKSVFVPLQLVLVTLYPL